MVVGDFLDEKRREMQSRLEELTPLVEEARRLEAALRALDGLDVPAAPAPAPRRAAAPKANGNGDSPGRGRPKGSGTRSKEALALVRERPGITIAELAEAMDIQQNYLYRVLPSLQKDGMVRKDGRGWFALDAA
jgi:hypothetical protein